MAQEGLVKSPFTINKNTNGVTFASADIASSTRFEDLLTYAVPLGMAVEVTPANYIFGEFKDTAGTAITAGMTRIVKTNASGAETREIFSGSNKLFGDLGDELKRPKIKVPVMVNASQQLKVQVYNLGTTLDVSASDFYIEATQYYEEI